MKNQTRPTHRHMTLRSQQALTAPRQANPGRTKRPGTLRHRVRIDMPANAPGEQKQTYRKYKIFNKYQTFSKN